MNKFACGLALVLAGCGASESWTVALRATTAPSFDPYSAANDMVVVRATLEGDDAYGERSQDFGTGTQLTFDAPLGSGSIEARVEGFNAQGDLVAYGQLALGQDDDRSAEVTFRRNVALVSHRRVERQNSPARQLYVMDVARSRYISQTLVPAENAVVRGVTARGADSFLVNYEVGASGFLGILSTEDETWRTFAVGARQERTLAIPGRSLAIGGGGGVLSLIDLDAGMVTSSISVGGRILDAAISADGNAAAFVIDVAPGLLLVDLSARCTVPPVPRSCVTAVETVIEPAGVALDVDGSTLYVVSGRNGTIASLNLSTGRSRAFTAKFPLGVRGAAYSAAIDSVLAVASPPDEPGSALTFVVPSESVIDDDNAVKTPRLPSDIAADPSGHRILIVALGTSTASAGLTSIDARLDPVENQVRVPEGRSRLYFEDPDDSVETSPGIFEFARYRPQFLAILNGR